MPKLSIVIPVYFNELNIPELIHTLYNDVLSSDKFEFELIFVDDGSGDASFTLLVDLAEEYPNIHIIKLSRNFGSHIAILAGLEHASGDCATVISADLQDPPSIIIEMFDKWSEGNEVVLAVRSDREESFIQKLTSNSYYALMKRFALKNMPTNGFDCFLIDRKVIKILTQMQEKNSTLMGQILWCGFNTSMIFYIRARRKDGVSRWTFSKKIKLFIDSFLAFSYFPIRLISITGMLVSFLSFIYAVLLVVDRVLNNTTPAGWTTLTILILFLSGIQMLMIGVLGEYLWRNFDETRNRPAYLIDKMIGFE